MNAVLAAAGSNLRKLLGLLRQRAGRFVFALCVAVEQRVFTLIRWCQDLIVESPDRPFHQRNDPTAA